jgi:hypothetical protein
LDYLISAGYGKTAEQFRQEAPNLVRLPVVFLSWSLMPLQADFQPGPDAKPNGLLVKKWTSVIRQQKKVRIGLFKLGPISNYRFVPDNGSGDAPVASNGGTFQRFLWQR